MRNQLQEGNILSICFTHINIDIKIATLLESQSLAPLATPNVANKVIAMNLSKDMLKLLDEFKAMFKEL